jgi:hypothetical protein
MNKMNQILVYVAAAHTMLSMMAMVIESRKRKRNAHVENFTYAPIEKSDRMRIDYLNNKIWKNDVTSVNMLRLTRTLFFYFSKKKSGLWLIGRHHTYVCGAVSCYVFTHSRSQY